MHNFGKTSVFSENTHSFSCILCVALGLFKVTTSRMYALWLTPEKNQYKICIGCHGTITAINGSGLRESRFSSIARSLF